MAISSTSSRDRTNEFAAVSASFNNGAPVALYSSHGYSEFIQRVQALSCRLRTCQRLVQRIEGLVSSKTLYYGNVGAEIDEVSALFEKESDGMDAEMEQARTHAERVSTSRHHRLHVDTVLNEIKNRKGKLNAQFQEALKNRAEMLRAKVTHHEAYGQSNQRKVKLDSGNPLFAQTHTHPTSHGNDDEESFINRTSGVRRRNKKSAISARAEEYQQTGIQQQHQQQMLLQEEMEEKAKKDALGRLHYAQSIEQQIEKLSDVFQQFSTMLYDQGEKIRLIDQDVELAGIEVDQGQMHVAKTYSIVKGNRSLIIQIFAVILVVAVLLVIY